MEHFWRELPTRSEFERSVGKEIKWTSDSGARMKCLSVSDFQVSERLANKANPSLLHRGLFSLLFIRDGKWGEVKSKHAEGARGIPVFLRAPPIFHFSGLSPFPAILVFSPSTTKEPLRRSEKPTPFPGSTLFSRWWLRRPCLFFPSSQNLNGSKILISQ